MAGPTHTRKRYKSLLDAYREHPEDHRTVAQMTGFGTAACRKAWGSGWAEVTWAPAIKEALFQERVIKQHAATPVQKEKISHARDSLIVATEAQARASEKLAQVFESVTEDVAGLSKSIKRVAELTAEKLEVEMESAEWRASDGIELLERYVGLAKKLAEIEHSHVASSLALQGITVPSVQINMSLEQLRAMHDNDLRIAEENRRLRMSNGAEIIISKETP